MTFGLGKHRALSDYDESLEEEKVSFEMKTRRASGLPLQEMCQICHATG